VSYLERIIGIAEEPSFGKGVTSATSYFPVNYALRCDITTDDTLVDDDIVSEYLDQVARTRRQREITGTLEFSSINPKIFKYSLGEVTKTTVTASQFIYSFTLTNSLPSFSLYQELDSPLEVEYYRGTMINVHRITIERGEDITHELTIVAKDVSFKEASLGIAGVDPTYPIDTSFDARFERDGTKIEGVQRFVLDINRNLEARWGSDVFDAAPRTVRKFRPHRIEVTGTIQVDEDAKVFKKMVYNKTSFTLTAKVFRSSWDQWYIQLKNCEIGEIPSRITGREPYELEFPFRARGSGTGLDAISVKWYQTKVTDPWLSPW